MGARPLRRTIEQYLEDPLAELLLLHPDEGRTSLVTVEGDALKIIDKEVHPIVRTPPLKKQETAAAKSES